MNPLSSISPPQRGRGLAMVEFVIVVPILLLLMLAVAELGRALYQHNTLTKAVRDSARYYSTHTDDSAGAVSLVQQYDIHILPPPSPEVFTTLSPDGAWVTVSAQYTFQFLPGNPLAGIMGLFGAALDPLVIPASVRMRVI